MTDQYGRQINYLRISVTDRCNLRCVYCMPEEGVCQVRHQDLLTYDEIEKIVCIAAGLGIERVRVTGGEPLVRKHIDRLISKMKQIKGIREVVLTTNGVLLKEQMERLASAGIDGINISLDTMDPDLYAAITRKGKLKDVLSGMEEVLRYPSVRLKLNCVPAKNLNERQWSCLAEFARNKPIDVRFIEMMPLGLGKKFTYCSQEEVLCELRKQFGQEENVTGETEPGEGPAKYVAFPGFVGRIGFISALSHKFCAECNRVRLTAEGFLKPCLQYAGGLDLKSLIRENVPEQVLEEAIRKTIYLKPACHHFETDSGEDLEQKDMFRIGG